MAVREVAIVGAGTMGAGIAQVAALHGCAVRLIDSAPGAAARARESVAGRLGRLVDRGSMSAEERDAVLGRIREAAPGGLAAALAGAGLVVEAVVEDFAAKSALFRELDAAAPPDAVLATNTSSLSIGALAESVRDPSRVVGMHFFNPAPVMALVEVVAAPGTGEEAAALVAETARAWGKIPARTKDTPGFIVNRVARTSYVEAFRMIAEGVAGPEGIDGAMRRLGRFRMGPLQVADLVGQEVNHAVTASVWEQSGRPGRFAPPAAQARLAERGELGRKTGLGAYDYSADPPRPNPALEPPAGAAPFAPPPALADAVDAFVEAAALCGPEEAGAAGAAERYAFARILATVLNEAARALGDGAATAEDIDAAMRHATNYPRGPVEWGRAAGYGALARLLRALGAESGDGRFAPAPLVAAG